jgi:glutamine synthetase
MEREERSARARQLADELTARGVRTVALTWVDNAGVTRVKTVPAGRFGHAAAWGIGMSPVFDVFLVDDSITTSTHAGGPTGDLRLYPDLERLTILAGQPGWAWAPADRLTQEASPTPVASGRSPGPRPSAPGSAASTCGWRSRSSGSSVPTMRRPLATDRPTG